MTHDAGSSSSAVAADADRNETRTEKLDRNWQDLLQELRVAQTGVQLLTGLLLTVPFQSRFLELAAHQRVVYLVTVSLSVLATGLLISPVVLHRVLFRLHARDDLIATAHHLALAGFAALGLAVVGVCELIFDVVLGIDQGITAAVVALVAFGVLWGVGPLLVRAHARRDD
ncbi:DUF6328 family protein [Pseudonocardia sp. CA-107938]|uniref:DUF6328 family protein n=1 Tax=Pseudonocardia sp. CA-107938 TaxID=3240021 RepID=UPI003D8F6F85